jgi:guanyl-specific ribonuclease Sa
MAKKQAIANDTAAATSARAAKPNTPRVKAAQHSKTVSTEPAISAAANPEKAREIIAEIAYGLWEARGCQNGAALEDWLRAEQEYRQRLSPVRI